jgi:hypothetical protein|tara:strand:+ start:163 stop:582 length:420 start_codon:yes stop_codon:yes gene_type:complete
MSVLRDLEDQRRHRVFVNGMVMLVIATDLIGTALVWQLVIIPIIQGLHREAIVSMSTLMGMGVITWVGLSVGMISQFIKSGDTDFQIAAMGDYEILMRMAVMMQTLQKRGVEGVPRHVVEAWSDAAEKRERAMLKGPGS